MWARAVLLSSFWRARVKLTLKVWVWAVLRHARDASTELLSRWYPAQAGSAEVSSAAPLRLVEGPENEMEGRRRERREALEGNASIPKHA